MRLNRLLTRIFGREIFGLRALWLAVVGAGMLTPVEVRAANISFGITVGQTLPATATSVKVGRINYFVYHGSFYQQLKVGYVLVPAPLGATIKELPRGATQFKLGKVTYYQHGGVFFKGKGRNFEVCVAPAGAPAEGPTTPTADNSIAVEFGDAIYTFHRGRFFIQSPDGLLGRSTPVGGTTRDFPPNAMSVWFRDGEYFECGGVFFKEVAGGGFKIVPPPWTNTNVVPDALAQAN
jgi:hypothetical protein